VHEKKKMFFAGFLAKKIIRKIDGVTQIVFKINSSKTANIYMSTPSTTENLHQSFLNAVSGNDTANETPNTVRDTSYANSPIAEVSRPADVDVPFVPIRKDTYNDLDQK
jgi:hypothetical protein